MAAYADYEIAQRNAGQPAHQQPLIVNQRADREGVLRGHAGAVIIEARKARHLKQHQEYRCATEYQPEKALHANPLITVEGRETVRDKYTITSPANYYRGEEMNNCYECFFRPNAVKIMNKQRENNTRQRGPAEKKHQGNKQRNG